MDIHEAAIAHFLTANGRGFICPQIDFAYMADDGSGGSCADFMVLALDESGAFEEAVLVEVSAASNISSLCTKLADADRRYLAPAERMLKKVGLPHLCNSLRMIAFVRDELVPRGPAATKYAKVTFFPLEEATFSYSWWNDRQRGLPDSHQQKNYWHSGQSS